jgi:hypothetical protein
VVRRTVLIANACGLAVGLAIGLAGCGGDGDLSSGIDRSVDRIQQLEDDVDELERAITTATTAVPPPATLATAPPTSRQAPAPTTTETTAPARTIDDAPEADIRALVGEATWDAGLPIPTACIESATFTPSGEAGINGGRITCTLNALSPQVESYYRAALTRGNFPFSVDSDDAGFAIQISSQASIIGTAAGDRTALTIEQRFP